MPKNWYQPDTIPRLCYFNSFKTCPLLSEQGKYYQCIKFEKRKILERAMQGDIVVNLLKSDIPSAGWWTHQSLSQPHNTKVSLPPSPPTQHPRTQGIKEQEFDSPFLFPKFLWWWEKGRTRRQHKDFRHSENKRDCCS